MSLFETTDIDHNATEAEFVAGTRLATWPSLKRWAVYAVGCIGFIAFVFYVDGPTVGRYAIFAVPAILITVILAAIYIIFPNIVRRSRAKSPVLRRRYILTASQDGISIQEATGSAKLMWTDIIRWRSNRAVTVLFVQPRVIITIPARIGTQGFDIELMKTRLSDVLGKPR